jgi:phage-related protein
MAVFPLLKTGAVSCYPLHRSSLMPVTVVPFVDGAEQRFPRGGKDVRRWRLELHGLDEAEQVRLMEFFEEMGGPVGEFEFQDPLTGTVHPACRFDQGTLEVEIGRNGSGSVTVLVRQGN